VSTQPPSMPPGYYSAQGDPPGTQRWWDGKRWVGGPQTIEGQADAGQANAGQANAGQANEAQANEAQANEAQGFVAGGWGSPAGPTGPGGRPLAEAGQRILARVIDAVLSGIVVWGISAALGFDEVNSVGFAVVSIIFTLAYEVGMVAVKGGTIGKLALGIGVIYTDGTYPPGSQPAVRRWLPNALGAIPLIGLVISLALLIMSLVALFNDPQRRTPFDKFANTYVIRTR
jgi:uncharacterized RDD family membrane protein YckC